MFSQINPYYVLHICSLKKNFHTIYKVTEGLLHNIILLHVAMKLRDISSAG